MSRYNIINSLHSFVVLNNFEQFSYIFLLFFTFFYFIFFKYITNLKLQIKNKKIKFFNILKLYFYIILIIFLYKIYFEILLFIFNIESKLEYLYFYKNINVFITFVLLTVYTVLKIKLIYFLFFISYFELLVFFFLIKQGLLLKTG